MRYAVILAGGSGKRLWPASRESKPKQLINLIDGACLADLAIRRLGELFSPDQTLVVTNVVYTDQIAACCPALPNENIIGEPAGRDTANAIALAAEVIHARDHDATMAVFTADHIIRPEDEFRRCVGLACEVAEQHPEALVTFGVKPTHPHTGLGYIHIGDQLGESVWRVLEFEEKPGHPRARQFVDSGRYFWNSGMFVWKVRTIQEAVKAFLPESAERLAPVGRALSKGQDIADLLADIYPALSKISIDFAVMEKATDVLMVELTCEWLDVGSWPAVAQVIRPDADGNAVVAPRAVILDGDNNVVFSEDDHLVALLGMDDCIIVHSADATLICSKADAQRLKDLVDLVAERFGTEYL